MEKKEEEVQDESKAIMQDKKEEEETKSVLHNKMGVQVLEQTAPSHSGANAVLALNEEDAIDKESVCGRFGWAKVSGVYNIPYIYRSGEKFCSVPMVESQVLYPYLQYMHEGLIQTCTDIKSVFMTEAECRLFNEINFIHCDAEFGTELLTTRDLLVSLKDVEEFYTFIRSCHFKILPLDGFDEPERCGLMRINGKRVMPYVVCDNKIYVPLTCFELLADDVELEIKRLDGWDLSYMKFCCYVIYGRREEAYEKSCVEVASLDSIKQYLNPKTQIEKYWPKSFSDSHWKILNDLENQNRMVQWTNIVVDTPTTRK